MAETLDLPSADTWSRISSKTINLSHKWTIDNFSFYQQKSPGEFIESSTFSPETNDNLKWCLRVYPGGHISETKDYCLIFLHFLPSNVSEVMVKFKLYVLGVNNVHEQSLIANKTFKPGNVTGVQKFIDKSSLQETANILLPDDKLTIFCEIAILQDIIKTSGKDEPIQIEVLKSRMNDDIGLLLENHTCSDVTFVFGGKHVKAHKAILAARSPVFLTMFEHDMTSMIITLLDINDIEQEVFMEMLTFIYTDKAPKLEQMASNLLEAADKYGLNRLKAMCCEALYKGINIRNAIDILILAYLHSANQLKALTINFICKHKKTVIETATFMSMATSYPVLVVEIFRASSMKENELKSSIAEAQQSQPPQ